MKRKHILQAFFLLFLVAGTIYIAVTERKTDSRPDAEVRKLTENIFGTIMHVTYTSPIDLNDSIMHTLRQVDSSLSMFNPKSTISRINNGESTRTDPMLRKILPIALEVSKATDGAFDITVAPLVNAWGFGFRNGQLPTDAQVDSIRQFVDWRKLRITSDSLIRQDERMVIDLSAIAKGFGSDCVAECLRRNGVSDFMVEIGGEVVCQGSNPKGEAWHIGITRPDETEQASTGDIEEVLQVHDCAMATSGNYRNYYIAPDGRKLAHTINPRSGRPIQHNILSSTVLAPTCAIADAYATSFMVLGLDSSRQVLSSHPELQAFLIYTDSQGKYQTWTNIIK